MRRTLLLLALTTGLSVESQAAAPQQITQTCIACHNNETTEGGLDLTALVKSLKAEIT